LYGHVSRENRSLPSIFAAGTPELLGLRLTYQLWLAIRSGTANVRRGQIRRRTRPWSYWRAIVLQTGFAVMCFILTILAPSRYVAASDLDLKTVLQGAAAAAASVPDRDMIEKVAALREVARAQAAAGEREGARGSVDIAFRSLAQGPPSEMYGTNAVVELSVASAGDDPMEVERLLKRAATISPKLALDRFQGYALRNLAEALARAGGPAAAIARAKSIADGNWRQAALEVIAAIETEGKSRPWIEQSVAAARGPGNRARVLAQVARRAAEIGDPATARWAIAEALRLIDGARSASAPDILVEIVKAQAAAGDVEGARLVADRIARTRDDWYLVEALTVLAVARAHAGDKPGALDSLQTSRDAALRLPTGGGFKPGSPRAEALGTTAAAYGRIGEGDRGAALAGTIPKAASGWEYLAAEALLAVARSQAEAGNAAGALARCGEALKLLSRPADVVRYRWTCGDDAGAWRAVRESPSASTALWSLAIAEASAGNLIGAVQAAEAIPDDRNRVLALASLAPLQAKAGDVAGARETARKVTDESRRASASQAVAWGRARAGDVRGAVDDPTAQQDPLLRARMLLGVAEAQLGWSTRALVLSETSTERPWARLPLERR
jgi:hypothetical protein